MENNIQTLKVIQDRLLFEALSNGLLITLQITILIKEIF